MLLVLDSDTNLTKQQMNMNEEQDVKKKIMIFNFKVAFNSSI